MKPLLSQSNLILTFGMLNLSFSPLMLHCMPPVAKNLHLGREVRPVKRLAAFSPPSLVLEGVKFKGGYGTGNLPIEAKLDVLTLQGQLAKFGNLKLLGQVTPFEYRWANSSKDEYQGIGWLRSPQIGVRWLNNGKLLGGRVGLISQPWTFSRRTVKGLVYIGELAMPTPYSYGGFAKIELQLVPYTLIISEPMLGNARFLPMGQLTGQARFANGLSISGGLRFDWDTKPSEPSPPANSTASADSAEKNESKKKNLLPTGLFEVGFWVIPGVQGKIKSEVNRHGFKIAAEIKAQGSKNYRSRLYYNRKYLNLFASPEGSIMDFTEVMTVFSNEKVASVQGQPGPGAVGSTENEEGILANSGLGDQSEQEIGPNEIISSGPSDLAQVEGAPPTVEDPGVVRDLGGVSEAQSYTTCLEPEEIDFDESKTDKKAESSACADLSAPAADTSASAEEVNLGEVSVEVPVLQTEDAFGESTGPLTSKVSEADSTENRLSSTPLQNSQSMDAPLSEESESVASSRRSDLLTQGEGETSSLDHAVPETVGGAEAADAIPTVIQGDNEESPVLQHKDSLRNFVSEAESTSKSLVANDAPTPSPISDASSRSISVHSDGLTDSILPEVKNTASSDLLIASTQPNPVQPDGLNSIAPLSELEATSEETLSALTDRSSLESEPSSSQENELSRDQTLEESNCAAEKPVQSSSEVENRDAFNVSKSKGKNAGKKRAKKQLTKKQRAAQKAEANKVAG